MSKKSLTNLVVKTSVDKACFLINYINIMPTIEDRAISILCVKE